MTSDNPLLFVYTKQEEKKSCCHIPHAILFHVEDMGPAVQRTNGSWCRGSELFRQHGSVNSFFIALYCYRTWCAGKRRNEECMKSIRIKYNPGTIW